MLYCEILKLRYSEFAGNVHHFSIYFASSSFKGGEPSYMKVRTLPKPLKRGVPPVSPVYTFMDTSIHPSILPFLL